MDPTTYRRLVIGLGVALAALVAAVILIDTDGEPGELPEPLRAVFPLPNDIVVRQTAIEVTLPIGYDMTLTVDGVRIPPDEIAVVPDVGSFRWQPGPGQTFEVWPPGDHTVEITWDRVTGGIPDPGEFRWMFRVA
jgi:hypothetical protein